jgi:nitroimidazol reductase NimA-like FMN-containing flavoprotein (pyridoxamine 5'-phosphate oxidase superfamily)
MASVKAPARDRPQLPKGYIKDTPKGMLTWLAVKKILTTFAYLWIATTDSDGKPHLVQQWGVWIDDVLYFDGSDQTRWARNLSRDPRLSFGMQSAHCAVYGEAIVDIVRGADRKLAAKMSKQYTAKYGRGFKYRPKPEQFVKGHVYRARPTKLIAFDVKKFNTSAARFTFDTAE